MSLSVKEKRLIREGFTEEEVLERPKWQGTKYRRVTGSSWQRHKDATQPSQKETHVVGNKKWLLEL